jgi:hypothetical protein
MRNAVHISIYIERPPGEFIFSLVRQPDMSEQQFEKDRQAVALDLVALKKLLESGLI